MQVLNLSPMLVSECNEREHQLRMREMEIYREIELAKINQQTNLESLKLTTSVQMYQIDLERQKLARQQESFNSSFAQSIVVKQPDIRPQISAPQVDFGSRNEIVFDTTISKMRQKISACQVGDRKAHLQAQLQAFALYCNSLNTNMTKRYF